MNREIELALRQQRLLIRSAALRESIAERSTVLEAPFAAADGVRAAARWVWRERVVLIGGAAAALVILRPRRAWRLAAFGLWAWRKQRRVRTWLVAAGLAPQAGKRDPGTAR